MFYQGSLLLIAVVNMVVCLPQPLSLEKLPQIPSITQNPVVPKVDNKIPKPERGSLQKMRLKAVPIIGNKPDQQDLQRRVSTLEAVFQLEGRIQVVGSKIIATSGKEVDFPTSNSTCNAIGGRIVAPMNEAENAAVLAIVKKYNRYTYLGLREGPIPGLFCYMNGSPAMYTHWRKGEPSGRGTEGCVEMYTDGQWNDKSCDHKRLTICEFTA